MTELAYNEDSCHYEQEYHPQPEPEDIPLHPTARGVIVGGVHCLKTVYNTCILINT